MAVIALPFPVEERTADEKQRIEAELLPQLPEQLRQAAEDNPHLLAYLTHLPVSDIGIPDYAPELNRKLGDQKQPNLIYPTHRDAVFVHIMPGPDRNHYIPIEPQFGFDLDDRMKNIEVELLNLGRKLKALDPNENKEKQFVDYLNLVVDVTDRPVVKNIKKAESLLKSGTQVVTRVKMTQKEYIAVKYLFIRNKIGLDIAIEALKDCLHQKKATVNEIYHYAKICRVSNVIRPYMEAL